MPFVFSEGKAWIQRKYSQRKTKDETPATLPGADVGGAGCAIPEVKKVRKGAAASVPDAKDTHLTQQAAGKANTNGPFN